MTAPRSRALPSPGRHAVLFAVVVALCLAQVAWWIYFQVGEASRLERAGELLLRGDSAGAAHELGAGRDESLAVTARRRRVMFLSEGIALSVLVLVGVVFFYLTIVREQRLRAAQERFLTGTTHELKTPVASVRLGVESLLAGTLPEEKRRGYLQDMLRETDRLEHGLSNVLAAAGLRHTRAAPRLQLGDLATDVRAGVEAVRVRAATARVDIALEDLEASEVWRDPQGVQRALANVLDNAIKFSTAQGKVRVGLHQRGDTAVVSVLDQGVGVSTDDLPHLGERFYRGRNAVHRGGSGLGLYLARELLAACGGTLTIASAGEGRGCRVEISLPRKRA